MNLLHVQRVVVGVLGAGIVFAVAAAADPAVSHLLSNHPYAAGLIAAGIGVLRALDKALGGTPTGTFHKILGE